MINKNIIALGFVSFFTDMASSMVTSVLPIYIVYVLHEGVDKLGYIVAIATFVSYAFRLLFGYLSDRLQIVKPFVVTGYLVSAVTKPLLAFSGAWQSIALLRGSERMGKAIRSATKDSLISAYSPKKSGKSFGFHKMMDAAGEMSGAIIAFGALYYLGKSPEVFKSIFLWTLLPGLLAVIVALFFVQDAPYKVKSKTQLDFSTDKKLMPILILFFIFTFFVFNESFFIIKAKESGIAITYIPLFIILLYFVQSVSSYYFGTLIDKFSAYSVLLFSMVAGIVSMILLYFNFVIASFILLGLFSVSSLNAIRAYISNRAHNKGSLYGIFYAGVALFGALGATVTGLIWKHYGEDGAILFSLGGLLCVVILYLFVREPENKGLA